MRRLCGACLWDRHPGYRADFLNRFSNKMKTKRLRFSNAGVLN